MHVKDNAVTDALACSILGYKGIFWLLGKGVSINYGKGGTNKSVGGSLNSSTLLWGITKFQVPIVGGSPNQISRDPKIGI